MIRAKSCAFTQRLGFIFLCVEISLADLRLRSADGLFKQSLPDSKSWIPLGLKFWQSKDSSKERTRRGPWTPPLQSYLLRINLSSYFRTFFLWLSARAFFLLRKNPNLSHLSRPQRAQQDLKQPKTCSKSKSETFTAQQIWATTMINHLLWLGGRVWY